MDRPKYRSTVVVGGTSQTRVFSAFPSELVNRQSGEISLPHENPFGQPFDVSGLSGAVFKAVPWQSGETPVSLASGVTSFTPEEFVLLSSATPSTSGTFTLRVAGESTTAISYDADASDVQTALEALPSRSGGDFNVTIIEGENLSYANASIKVETSGSFALDYSSTIDTSALSDPDSLGFTVTQKGSNIENEYTASWAKDSIPANYSDYGPDRNGAIVFYTSLEDADDAIFAYQRINVLDDDFVNGGGAIPSTATYVYNPNDNNAWLRKSESAPTQIGEGLDKLVAKNFRDFGTVLDFLDTPPGSPNDGDAYLVIATATGDWAGKETKIAKWSSTLAAWSFSNVHRDWDEIRNADDGNIYRYNSTGPSWDLVAGGGGSGDVVGPGSSVDGNITTFDGVTGKLIQDSGSAISDLMDKATYDAAAIAEQVVGLTATQTLTNKTVNGVVLDATGSATNFLNEQGNYVAPAGGGDVVGPASAVDDNLCSFDTTTGKLIQDSGVSTADVVANNAKVTNATHTGEVTGSTTLTIDSTAITNKTTVTAATGDLILISDASDAGALKKVDADDFLSGGGLPTGNVSIGTTGTVDVDWSLGDTFEVGTLTGDLTLTFSNVSQGQTITIDVTGASGFTFDLPSSCDVALEGTDFTADVRNLVHIKAIDGATSQEYVYNLTTASSSAGGILPESESSKTADYTVVSGDIGTRLELGSATVANRKFTLDVSLFTDSTEQISFINKSDYRLEIEVSNTGTMTFNDISTNLLLWKGDGVLTINGDTATNANVVARG